MERTSEERRTWNTPVREPWNPVIKHCLKAVDEHMRLYLKTYDPWHLAQAEVLRTYTLELKKWIHFTEGKVNFINETGKVDLKFTKPENN